MFVFNEGVPRSGKSYDAVLSHILPALKAGRQVHARLNGLNVEKIAAYLELPEEEIAGLLTHVATADVASYFVAERNEAGEWTMPDRFKDALCVIDECHQFYVAGRQALPPEQEEFFALLGQNGGDAVVLSQSYKRVHGGLRARIEKKNSFQKMEAAGMKGRYKVTYWQTVAPDKYEKVGAKVLAYDPAIFPLYAGYADGSENREVYANGSRNYFQGQKVRLAMAALAIGLGLYSFLGFFRKPDAEAPPAVRAPAPGQPVNMDQAQAMNRANYAAQQAGQPAKAERKETNKERKEREKEERLAKLEPAQRYVVGLADKARVRLAARMGVGPRTVFAVEWITPEDETVERLSGDALRDMGFEVDVRDFGVVLSAGSESIVATAWPLERVRPTRPEDATLYNVAPTAAGFPPSAASREPAAVASATGTNGTAFGTMAGYGAIGVGASPR